MLVTEIIKAQIREECLKDLKTVGIHDINKDINAPSDTEYLSRLGLSKYIV